LELSIVYLKYYVAYNVLVGKRSGRSLGKYGCRYENIKIDLMEMGWEKVDWIHLVQNRDQWRDLVDTVRSLRVP
jgi:hypothetical protein